MIVSAWRECKLGDVITLKRGYDLPRQQRALGPFPIVSSSGVIDYHAEAKVPGPGVVTGRYGTLGEVFFIEGDFWPLNTALYVRDFKGNDLRFVSYFLRLLNFGTQNAAGAVPGVNRNHLHAMDVRVPPLPTQRRIAGILSAYDDLIENCARRIRVLDEMARALYREWFVLFRYPGHEKIPLVDSPLGPIPKGWTVTPLAEVTTKIGSGATPRGGKEAYKAEGISLVRSLNIYDDRFELADLAFIDDEQAGQLHNVVVEPFDILLNITGASVARCAMVPSFVLPARVNQHVAIVRADTARMDAHFLLDSINSERNKAHLLALAQGGATREALTKETISRFQILLPPLPLVRRYGEVAAPSQAERESLRRRSEILRRTRDLVLPRLLSGQLSVEEAA